MAEDPFEPNLDPSLHGSQVHAHAYTKDEEPAYWNHGDVPLIVNTPKEGRKVFTCQTHMPTPTKAIFFTNVNLINNAKWTYGMIKNVNPKIELIVSNEVQMTASIEQADFGLPANSWVEFQDIEVTASCSNPFLQIWKGGIKPVYDSKDDLTILAGIAKGLGKITGDKRSRIISTSSTPANERFICNGCSTRARRRPVTSSPISWPANTALRAAAC